MKPLSKLTIIMLMLLTFVGQAVASNFAVSLIEHSQQIPLKVQSEFTDIKSATNDVSEDKDDCCEVECCENECICPANACASLIFLELGLTSKSHPLSNEPATTPLKNHPTFFATSLYRPPIFTS